MTKEIYLKKDELNVGSLIEALEQFPTDLKVLVSSEAGAEEDEFNSVTLTLYTGQNYLSLTVWEGW